MFQLMTDLQVPKTVSVNEVCTGTEDGIGKWLIYIYRIWYRLMTDLPVLMMISVDDWFTGTEDGIS